MIISSYMIGAFKKFLTRKKHPEPIPDWFDVWQDVMPKITPFNQRHIPACVAHTTVIRGNTSWDMSLIKRGYFRHNILPHIKPIRNRFWVFLPSKKFFKGTNHVA